MKLILIKYLNFQVYSDLGKKHFIDILFELNWNTWTESKDIPCNPAVNTKYDDVIYNNLEKELVNEFNCTVPFLPTSTIKASDRVDICKDPETRRKAYARYDLLKRNNENKLCKNPCNTVQPYFGLFFQDPKYKETDKAYLKIYLQSMTTIRVTVMDYDGIAMIADIGGYTGLLLGMSAIHLSRFVFKSILKLINAPRKIQERKTSCREKRRRKSVLSIEQ